MDEFLRSPVSQRMCAPLHRNSTDAAPGARHSAIRPDSGTGTL
jgi:hypothetical protein